MKCSIPGPNVKVLAKAIHALAKIGDEMYVQPQKDSLSLRTVSLANSAYSDFTFNTTFFSFYNNDEEVEDVSKWKISMRSAVGVFKTPNLLDKQVESCHIKIQPDAEEVLFVLKYKNAITKTYLVPILECGELNVLYETDTASNQFLSQARALTDALQNFQQNLIEITLELLPQKMLLRNYISEESGKSQDARTQLAIAMGEFDRYIVNSETAVTFCMKELKAILGFAETVGVLINAFFEAPGSPAIFKLKDMGFEANLVLATVNTLADTQTDTTVSERKARYGKRTTNRSKTNRSTKSFKNGMMGVVNQSKLLASSIYKDQDASTTSGRPESINTNSTMPSPMADDKGLSQSIANISNSKNQNCVNNAEKVGCQSESSKTLSNNTLKFKRNSSNKTEKAKSLFSGITRNSSNSCGNIQGNESFEGAEMGMDVVPSSPPPPAKKARYLFKKCFESTFDPRTLPGHEVILAEDSGDEC